MRPGGEERNLPSLSRLARWTGAARGTHAVSGRARRILDSYSFVQTTPLVACGTPSSLLPPGTRNHVAASTER